MKTNKLKLALLSSTITLLLAGCGSDNDENEPEVVDTPPVIQLDSTASVKEGESTELSATVTDDNASISYNWVQDSGPNITLTGADTNSISFIAPALDNDTEAMFTLTATDSAGQATSKSITVSLLNNVAPKVSADFGSAQEKSMATLSVNATDDDGSISSYNWEQTAGPTVTLSSATEQQVSFTLPSVAEDTELKFKVTVTDDSGDSTELEQSFIIASIDNTYTLAGSITGDKFSNATVNATLLGTNYTQTSDANGDFTFTFTVDDDETNLFSRINAISATNSSLEYSAFVSDLTANAQVQAAPKIKANFAHGDEGANTVSLSAVSTALVALITAANEGIPPADLESFSLVEKGVDPDVLIEAAAVVKYATENEVTLPEGTENLIDLIENPDAYNEFVAAVEQSNPGAIENEVAKIIADPELTPPVDESSLPAYYVRTYPTATGFLSRGGQQYTFEENGMGKYVHSSGAVNYNWALTEGVITLDFTSGQGIIGFLSVDVGVAGLSQQQVDDLFNAGIYQVEVTYSPQTATLKRIVEGESIDSYRLTMSQTAQMTPIYLGENVIETPEFSVSNESDVSMRKPYSGSDLAFKAEDMAGTWAIQHYQSDSDDGVVGFVLDPYVFSADNTGKLQDAETALQWQIEEGVLKVTFPDQRYQESRIIDQLNGDLQLLNVAYSAEGAVIATEVMYGFKVDETSAAAVDVTNEPGNFWQTMINQWTKANWKDGKLEFYYEGNSDNGFNVFGFQLTKTDSRRLNLVNGTEQDYTLDGVNVGWMQESRDVTINYFGNFSCSDDMSKPCRKREWEILKSQPGVAGERLYVKEKDYYLLDENGWYNSQGAPSLVIAPRINIYETIPENYWMPETMKSSGSPSLFNTTSSSTNYTILSPNKDKSSVN